MNEFLILGLALAAGALYEWVHHLRSRRARQRREEMRHVIGALPWWGRR